MNISRAGIDLIESFEGLRLVAYKAVKTEKYWTIGYGHYGPDVTEGMKITKEQAEEYLRQDIKSAEKAVNAQKYKFTQGQYNALVSFTFNCGSKSLSTLTQSGSRTIEQIACSLPKYNKAGGKELLGLTRRRAAELAMYLRDTPRKTNEELADEVLSGLWGNNGDRRKNLTLCDYSYPDVQRIVNERLKKK